MAKAKLICERGRNQITDPGRSSARQYNPRQKIPKLNDNRKAHLWPSEQMKMGYQDCRTGNHEFRLCIAVNQTRGYEIGRKNFSPLNKNIA